MELRGCSNLYFIQALKGGTVTKVLNVFRRKPGLKFKKIQEVYETAGAKTSDPLPTFRPKVEIEDSPIGCYKAKAKNLYDLKGKKAEVEGGSKFSEPDCSTPGAREASDSDDLSFLTLKEIKAKCKAKKRRCRAFADSGEITEVASFIKPDCSSSQFEEDDCDVTETLSVWKARISKNKRKKRKVITKNISTPSQMALSVLKYEDIQGDQFLFQSSANVLTPVPIKVEVSEPVYSDHKGEGELALCSFSFFDELVYSGGVLSGREPEIAHSCDWETKMLLLSGEKHETAEDSGLNAGMLTFPNDDEPPCCVSNDYCYMEDDILALTYSDCQDMIGVAEELSSASNGPGAMTQFISADKPEAANGADPDFEMLVASDEEPEAEKGFLDPGMLNFSNQEHETANDCGSLMTCDSNELQFCVLNEECYAHLENTNHNLVLDIRDSAKGNMLVDDAEETLHCHSDFIMDPCLSNDSPQPVSPSIAHVFNNCHNSQSLPVSPQKLSKISSNNLDELSNRPGSCLPKDEPDDETPHLNTNVIGSPVHNNIPCGISNLCSSPNDGIISVSDDCPGVEKKPLFSVCVDGIRNFPTKICPDVDEPVTPIEAKDYNLSKMQHPPKRLLSNRKVISPTSQKRLQKAMESAELDDEQYYKYTRKLCYRKQTDFRSDGLAGHNWIERAEITNNPKQLVRKASGNKNGSSHKGILSVAHPSRAVPRISTACTSVQSCSESAVAFSQQQMRDIETIASKLTRELKSMKDIVEETFHSEVYVAAPVKRSADEVKVAIHNATKVEEGARRWLSMMARDCDRFCKIMKLIGKGPAAPGNVVSKEKRKIVFADEAGGKLCDVKSFENEMTTSIEFESAP